MSRHAHADYAPPRSSEPFEELCADIFQSAWRDPALVRHGRAGQRQNGVDIVARNGAIYPIGLPCKKRSKWPVSKLTTKQIDAEVAGTLKFTPALDPQLADKHFGPSGGGAPRPPLLATWMMSKGKLEKTGAERELSVKD